MYVLEKAKEDFMKKNFIITIITLICMMRISVFPCTIFNASKGGRVLAGNTEDMSSTDTRIWFFPPSEGKYGVVYVGFERYGRQGAMNDQGLFFDCNALKFSKMRGSPEKLRLPEETIIEKIMEGCATVENVIALLDKYNLEGWDNFQVMFVDRAGASAVLGADKNGELAITRKKGDYQVSTNFNLANPEFGAYRYPCYRFDTANEMLKNMKELTVDYFRSILAAVHSEGTSPTVYANICDLTNGDIYIYNFHNFEEVVKFNLAEEFKKGEHSYVIASLFPRKTNAQRRFEETQKKMLSKVLLKTMEKEGMKAAIKKFNDIKDEYSPIPGELEKLAFLLRLKGKINERLEIFKLYTKEFPKSSRGHKMLGDLYLNIGDQKRAIKSYKKVLKLDPKNTKVTEILHKLEK